MVFRALLAAGLAITVALQAGAQVASPAGVRADARRAVEGGVAAVQASRWRAHLRADPSAPDALLGLGTLAALRYDHASAGRLLRTLVARPSTSPLYRVHAQLELGHLAHAGGDYLAAQAQFAAARTGARNAAAPAAEAEALVGLAKRAGAGDPALALATLDTAARLVPRGDTALLATVRSQRAYVLAMTSDARAVDEAGAAIALARAAGDARQEAHALYARAADFRLRHEGDSAMAAFRQAAALQRRVHDRAALANTLVSIADLLRQQEELAPAREVLHEAASEAAAAGNRRAFARATLGLGVIAMAFRDYVASAASFASADSLASALGDTSSLITTRAFKAYLHLATGDLTRARAASAWALERFRRANRWYEATLIAEQLAAIERRSGNFPAAGRLLAAAADDARRQDLAFLADRLAGARGHLALAQGNFAGARAEFGRFLPQLGDQEHVARYSTQLTLARIEAELGFVDEAVQRADDATRAFDAWRASLPDREQRLLAFQTDDQNNGDRDVAAAHAIDALARAGRVEAARRIAEHRRARMLAESVVRAAAGAPGSSGDTATAAQALGGTPFTGAGQTAQAAAAAAAVGDGRTAVLEFVTGGWGAPTTLFVMQRLGDRLDMRAFRLPAADSLAVTASRLLALLEAGSDPRVPARAVGAALLDSAAASLHDGVTRLLVVPDGMLHRVPFDALRLRDGSLVVQRFAIGVVPSVAVLAGIRERRAATVRPSAVSLLALGDPDFSASTDTRASRDFRRAFDLSGGLARLRGSGREARLVAQYADSAVVLLRGDASASFLTDTPIGQFSVVHLATHALVDDRSNTYTALALAPTRTDDGFVSRRELATLALAADLVVLSACRSAGGRIVTGEGMLGLTGPLMEAGAQSVVATAWAIRDREVTPFVRDFYDAMAAGEPVGDALRTAKLASLARGAPAREWAAFQVFGDPLARPPLRTPSEPPLQTGTALLLLAALTGAGLAYGSIRRRRAAERRSRPSSERVRTVQ